jgi:hypothetical protein
MGGYNLMPTSEACSKTSDFAKQIEEKSKVSTRRHFALGRWNYQKVRPYFSNPPNTRVVCFL